MSLNQSLLEEYNREAALTRKMLERVPLDNPDWQPHDMSMTIQRLASHIAEIPLWTAFIVNAGAFDFAKTVIERFFAKSNAELLERFNEKSAETNTILEKATDEQLLDNWTVRRGDIVVSSTPRITGFRSWVINHSVHHRGQLSVYLRLNNVPVPGMYGPSADERKAMTK